MTNILLNNVGTMMYGPNWQAPLANAITVSDRTMRRWLSGADAIPLGAWHDIYRQMDTRAIDLGRMHQRLAGILGQSKTLRPIENSKPGYSMEGVFFAMLMPGGQTIRCLVRREVIEEALHDYKPSAVIEYFTQRSDSFYRAASTKYDLGEYDLNIGMIIGNADVIPALNST